MSVTNIHLPMLADFATGAFAADATGRARFATGFFNEATVDAKFVAGAIDATDRVKIGSVYEDRIRVANANAIGALRMCHATYDFAVLGGAVSTILLTGGVVPDNALVLGGIIDVTTSVTGGAGARLGLNCEAPNDLAAIAVLAVNWAAGSHDILPVRTAASAVKTTAARPLTVTIDTNPLTAGVFTVDLYYVIGA